MSILDALADHARERTAAAKNALPLAELREKYRAVELTAEQAERYRDGLIGCKRAKQGFTALVERGAFTELGGHEAGLEEIMVHLDKEARDDG